MKKFTFSQFLLFIGLLFTPFLAKSQVSVTADDFISVLVTGNTYITYMDTTTQQVDVGTSGQNHWDLSGLTASSDFETESKLVSSSPYTDEFPDADYASNYSGVFSGVQSNSWVYNSIDSGFITHGSATVADATVDSIETLIKYDPAWVQYSLPMQYGDSVGYTGTQTIESTTTIPGVGETKNTIEQAITVTQKVDGYGTVTYPGGDQYQVLRIVEETTFDFDGVISSHTIVRLVSKTGESVTFSPADSSSYSGVINVENVSWTTGSGSGVIDVEIDAPTTLAAAAGDGQIDITWSDNSDNETGFYIERAEDGGTFVVIDSTSAGVTTYSDTDAEAGIEYTYRVQAYNDEGTSEFSATANATIVASSINYQAESQFQLEQNFPNPFQSTTTIRFSLSENENVKLNVYDLDGKLVKKLGDSRLAKGEHSISLSAAELENGTYFYQLETKNSSETKFMVIMK